MTAFCAICSYDIPAGAGSREPIGKGRALVSVCDECNTEPARTSDGPGRSYEAQGGLLTRAEASEGEIRAMGPEERARIAKIEHELYANGLELRAPRSRR